MRRAKNYGRATNSMDEDEMSRLSLTKSMSCLFNEMYKDNQRIECINIQSTPEHSLYDCQDIKVITALQDAKARL